MIKDYFMAFARHGLAAGGVWLLNHGYITQNGYQFIMGGGLALSMFAWSLLHKKGVAASVADLKAQVAELTAPQPVAVSIAQQQATAQDAPRGSSGGLVSKLPLLLVLAGGLALAAAGCGHATLQPGGAYAPADTNGVATAAPDFDLYVVDSAYSLAHDAAEAVFNFERSNRTTLWQISPAIKHSLDQARAQVLTVEKEFATARTAYLASPLPANLSTLQAVLAKMQQLANTAAAVLAAHGTTTNAPPALPVSLPAAPANPPASPVTK